jgi:polyisoprenoid-binding protein YceI
MRYVAQALLGATIAWLGAAATVAQAQTPAALVPDQSEIVFACKQMGVPVEGRFKRFDAQIVLDPRKPESGSVSITIDMQSASFGVAEADEEIAKPAWFDTKRHPKATFRSASIRGQGGGRLEVAGALALKGIARDQMVPVTITQSGGTSTATGRFTLKRLDYKIGDGEWADTSMVGNDVQVTFKLVLTGLGPL